MDRKKLENYIPTKKRINFKLKELEEKKETVNRLVASYGGEKVSSSRLAEDGTAERLVNILDNQKEIEQVLELWELEIIEVDKGIEKLDNTTYKLILEGKYKHGHSLETIADYLGYDYKYTCRLHGYALKEWDKL